MMFGSTGWCTARKVGGQLVRRRRSSRLLTTRREKGWKDGVKGGLLSSILIVSSDGGGISFAVRMFRRFAGVEQYDSMFTTSLVGIPLSVYFFFHGIETAYIYWPGCLAFSLSTVASRAVFGKVFSEKPLASGMSNLLFSVYMGAIGVKVLHEAYKESLLTIQPCRKHHPPPNLVKIREAPLKLVQQWRDNLHDKHQALGNYIATGVLSSLCGALLGPTWLSIPVPLLIVLQGLSPHQAVTTFVSGWIVPCIFNIYTAKVNKGKPRLVVFVPFVLCVTSAMYTANEYVLPNLPEHYLHILFGISSCILSLRKGNVALTAIAKTQK
mmetsp:Transcript_22704/g.36172  ORF Transcript_22704/g.36172 Transcript_22704/m.36172 type:complete len:325 (-) Transcript_22704:2335-3309(-)